MDLLEKLQHIEDLPTIPTTLTRVMELTAREETSAADLAKVINADQSVAVKVLKVANSAFFGLPRKISDLQRAVTMLGFLQVRDLCLGLSVFDSLFLPTKGAYFNRAKFWKHCYIVAHLTREIARRTAGVEGGNAFAAGLLHDVGKVFLDRYFSALFRKILEEVDLRQASFHEVEQELIGTGHEVIGAYLLSRWNLPDDLVAGVGGHHRPSGEPHPMAARVYLANWLAHASGFSAMPSEPPIMLDEILVLPETEMLRVDGRLPHIDVISRLFQELQTNSDEISAHASMLM